MKPLIGITTGEIINVHKPWELVSYGQRHEYSDAIIAAGGVPVLIPFMPEGELRELYERLDGILFSGGNDINPTLYGESPEPETHDVTPERDRVESLLMDWALADDKPVFAICRGFQFLNVFLGGSLHQHLARSFPGASNHESSLHQKDLSHIAHTLRLAPDSRLATILGSPEIEANSRHHQGIKVIAPGVRATAWSEDGVVEALEHTDRTFVLGVQCHPESLLEKDSRWLIVFKEFIIAAHSYEAIPIESHKTNRSKGAVAKTGRPSRRGAALSALAGVRRFHYQTTEKLIPPYWRVRLSGKHSKK